jgi:glucosamine--fructose-6-phosphate aminotransferase (isomerizing)
MTDTEVLVNFIEHIRNRYHVDTLSAMQIALRNVIGAYALALIDRNDPDTLYAARKSSPLAVGVGQDNTEFFLASDATPIVTHTNHIVYLNDGEIAVLKRNTPIRVVNLDRGNRPGQAQQGWFRPLHAEGNLRPA